MAAIPPATLKELWLSGQEGRLSPWEVAKALAFREASKEIHDGVPDLGWIAERLTKVGGGHAQEDGSKCATVFVWAT